MTAIELGRKLNDMYQNAPRGEQVAMIHLFGIVYSKDILEAGIREVVEASGIRPAFKVEVNKGVKLANYVQKKNSITI